MILLIEVGFLVFMFVLYFKLLIGEVDENREEYQWRNCNINLLFFCYFWFVWGLYFFVFSLVVMDYVLKFLSFLFWFMCLVFGGLGYFFFWKECFYQFRFMLCFDEEKFSQLYIGFIVEVI